MTTRILTLSLALVALAAVAQAQTTTTATTTPKAKTPAVQAPATQTPTAAKPATQTPTTAKPATPATQSTPPAKGTTPPPQAAPTPAKGTPAKVVVKKKKPARMKFFNMDAGAQMNPSKVTPSLTYKLYGEDARFDATYDTGVVPIFGVRAGINLRKRMMVGVGGSLFSTSKGVVVKAQLPHPFFFDKKRPVDGVASGITRSEAAIYAEVGWLKPVTKKLDVMFLVGPAAFHVSQKVVTRVIADDRYPYDSASFTGADSVSVAKWAPGVTAGLDVGYLVRKKFRVGALVRYSYASAKVSPVANQSFTLALGGVQTSVGLRFRF